MLGEYCRIQIKAENNGTANEKQKMLEIPVKRENCIERNIRSHKQTRVKIIGSRFQLNLIIEIDINMARAWEDGYLLEFLEKKSHEMEKERCCSREILSSFFVARSLAQ